MLEEAASAPYPGTSDFASLAERMRVLLAMRLGFALVAVAAGSIEGGSAVGPKPGLVLSALIYAALETAVEIARQRRRGRGLILLTTGVLLDGVFLTWMIFLTGGASSPFHWLIYVHVIAVSLLASYRTGVKVAVWDSLLLLLLSYARDSGALATPASLTFGFAMSPAHVVWLMIPTLWGVTIATATFTAANERTLRRKRGDLEALARMVAELGQHDTADAVPRILLDSLNQTFGLRRGLVLASPAGDLSLLASFGIEAAEDPGHAKGRVVERAFETRSVQLVRELDPDEDPWLHEMLPGARNLLVVPLFLSEGYRLGVLVVERLRQPDRIHSWTVAIIQQFAAHAAVRLHNAWLMEDNQAKLAEIRQLRDELVGQNLTLEARVAERTQELSESLRMLKEADAERQRLLTHLVSAQEDERRRIAEDIHDDPLQVLVTATMRLDLLRRSLGGEPGTDEVSETREMVREVIAKLRSMMFELRPETLEKRGLAAAVRAYGEQWRLEPRLVVRDRFDAEPPPDPRLILYRIVQEALANIRKHAQAANVIVTLEQHDKTFLVRVEDDGVGFQPSTIDRQGHIGLTSMRERAEMAGGGCRIHSLPGGGTTVEFWVPASVDQAGAERAAG